MTKLTEDRAEFLVMFDDYVREYVSDENYLDYWLQEGIPDGWTEDDLIEIAEDDELWLDVINTFAYVIKYGETAEQAVSFLCKIFSKKVLTNFPKCAIMVGLLTCAFTRQQAEFTIIPYPRQFVKRNLEKNCTNLDPAFCAICTLTFFYCVI